MNDKGGAYFVLGGFYKHVLSSDTMIRVNEIEFVADDQYELKVSWVAKASLRFIADDQIKIMRENCPQWEFQPIDDSALSLLMYGE